MFSLCVALSVLCVCVRCAFVRPRGRARFLDDEADASACGSESEQEGVAAAEEDSLGSLADFIAEPTEDELGKSVV